MIQPKKKLFALAGVLFLTFLIAVVLIQTLHIPILTDPHSKEDWLAANRPLAAVISFGLLTGDIFLPVPSSLLMALNGKLFGMLGGTLISLLGYTASGVVGYIIGHFFERFVYKTASEEDLKQAESLTKRWGICSVILSRPIPLLAETVSICAGAARMKFKPYLLGLLLGSLPLSLIYAIAGAWAENMQAGIVSLVVVMALSVAGWAIGKRL